MKIFLLIILIVHDYKSKPFINNEQIIIAHLPLFGIHKLVKCPNFKRHAGLGYGIHLIIHYYFLEFLKFVLNLSNKTYKNCVINYPSMGVFQPCWLKIRAEVLGGLHGVYRHLWIRYNKTR